MKIIKQLNDIIKVKQICYIFYHFKPILTNQQINKQTKQSYIQFYYFMKNSFRKTATSLSKLNKNKLIQIYSPQNKKQKNNKQSSSSNIKVARSYSDLLKSHFDLSRSENSKFRSSKSIRKKREVQNQEQQQKQQNLYKSEFFTTIPLTMSTTALKKQKQQNQQSKRIQTVKQLFAQKASICPNLIHQVQENFLEQRILKQKIQQLKKAIAHQRKQKSKVSMRLNKILNANEHAINGIKTFQNNELELEQEINSTQKEVNYLQKQNNKLSQKQKKIVDQLQNTGQIVEILKKTVYDKRISLQEQKKTIATLKQSVQIKNNFLKNLSKNHQILNSTQQNMMSQVSFDNYNKKR